MDLLALDGTTLLLRRRRLPEEDTVEEGARVRRLGTRLGIRRPTFDSLAFELAIVMLVVFVLCLVATR